MESSEAKEPVLSQETLDHIAEMKLPEIRDRYSSKCVCVCVCVRARARIDRLKKERHVTLC